MNNIAELVADLRNRHETLQSSRLPIDILSFVEIDLGLDILLFPDLKTKFDVEAALTSDLKGIYVDDEQYRFFDQGPEWKAKRLRFTLAHEMGHYYLHQDLIDHGRMNGNLFAMGARMTSSVRPTSLPENYWCPKNVLASIIRKCLAKWPITRAYS
jgi:hypothetical protein